MVRKQSKHRRQTAPPACPECGSSEVVPIIHGIITPSRQKLVEQGKAVRADREEWEGITEWYCKQCGCDWSRQWKRFKKPASLTPKH